MRVPIIEGGAMSTLCCRRAYPQVRTTVVRGVRRGGMRPSLHTILVRRNSPRNTGLPPSLDSAVVPSVRSANGCEMQRFGDRAPRRNRMIDGSGHSEGLMTANELLALEKSGKS